MVREPMRRELREMEKCGRRLIAIKDEIHTHWANAQKFFSQWKEPPEARYPVPSIETTLVLQATKRASKLARECGVKPEIVELIDKIHDSLWEKLGKTYDERVGLKNSHIFDSSEDAEDFLFGKEGFNGIASAVHEAGYDMLLRDPFHKNYAGCRIYGRDLDNYSMAFCEGAPSGVNYMGDGRLEVNLGAHRATVTLKDIGPKVRDVEVKYDEAGYKCSTQRLRSVMATLEKEFDFDCKHNGFHLECDTKIEDPRDSRKLGTFLFGVKDMDIWSRCDCVPEGVDMAFQMAETASTEEGWVTLEKLLIFDTDCYKRLTSEEKTRVKEEEKETPD